MRTTRQFASLIAVAVASACAHPAHLSPADLVTDRPDFTESAPAVPTGFTQVEGGSTYAREAGVKSVSAGETLVRVGFRPHTELRLTAPSYSMEVSGPAHTSGFEDAGIGFKFALFEGPDHPSIIPSVSTIVATSVPTGSTAFRGGRALPEVKLIGSWTISDRFAFTSNVNWARAEAGSATYDEFAASGSFGISLSDRIGAYAEAYSFAGHIDGWQRATYVNSGLTFLVTDWIQLDTRVGVRTNAPTDGTFVGVGFARRF